MKELEKKGIDEINAYTNEAKEFPSETLDIDYANHRDIEIWRAQEMLDIANTYYNK